FAQIVAATRLRYAVQAARNSDLFSNLGIKQSIA
ncbi:MAG: guanylate kinase, partial [Pusillimonas sp.]